MFLWRHDKLFNGREMLAVKRRNLIKKISILASLAVFLLTISGCEGSSIKESALTPEEKIQITCDGFVERYNAFIEEANEIGYFSSKTISELSQDNHSFRPNEWCSFDVHFDQNGNISSVIFGAEGAALAKVDEPTMPLIAIMSAIACGVDSELSTEQRQNFAVEILDNYFNVMDLDTVYETQVNDFKYEFYVKLGYISMKCSPVSDMSSAQTKEEKETKDHIWNRSESDIVESIRKVLEGQTMYDGEYSVVEQTGDKGTVYVFTYNGEKTGNVFTISENTSTHTNQITYISSNLDNHVFDVGATAIVMVCDRTGRNSSMEEAHHTVADIFSYALICRADENGVRSETKLIDSVEYGVYILGEGNGPWTFTAGKPVPEQ